VALGCGGGAATRPKTKVSGTVTLDDKPLAEGEIAFTKTAEGVADSLPIKDGKFEGDVSLGERKVEIRAFKEVAQQGAEGMYKDQPMSSKENYLPAKYNSESTFKETVAAGKKFDFKVTSN